MAKQTKTLPAKEPKGRDPVAAITPEEIKPVMAAGFDEAAAKAIIAQHNEPKLEPVVEAPKPKKFMLAVRSVGEKGFGRFGVRFSHTADTLLDPDKLTDTQLGLLDEAVRLKVLVVREVEA